MRELETLSSIYYLVAKSLSYVIYVEGSYLILIPEFNENKLFYILP